jgi:uncharacterized metal-binding protein
MSRGCGKVLVIPCSGIGKVHGLLSRESAYLVTDELAPDGTDVVCLALLVREDAETLARVRCISIDGCAKACAQKNIVIAGGQVASAFQVAKVLTKHRESQPGTGSELTEEGWAVCREIAEAVAQEAVQICNGQEVS